MKFDSVPIEEFPKELRKKLIDKVMGKKTVIDYAVSKPIDNRLVKE
jgi:hypothetical protein